MKKFASMFLASVMMLTALTGCGGKEETPEAPAPEAPAPTETAKPEAPAEVTFDDDISMYVHVAVGGALDVRARVVADYLSEELGVNVNVVNITGAGGVTCATQMLAQPSSPYDMLFAASSVFTSCPLFTPTTYSVDDFRPLTGVDTESFGLFTDVTQSGIANVDDLKAVGADEEIIYGSGGTGNITQLYQAAFYNKLGLTSQTLVHNGAVEGITNAMGGHNMITMAGMETARSYVESGDMTPILTFNGEDFTGYEGITVPSVTKVGGDSDNVYQSMMLITALASIDDDHYNALHEALQTVLADENCINDLKAVGLTGVPEIAAEDITPYLVNEISVMEAIIASM